MTAPETASNLETETEIKQEYETVPFLHLRVGKRFAGAEGRGGEAGERPVRRRSKGDGFLRRGRTEKRRGPD